MPSKLVPEDWVLTPALRDFARSKGLTEAQIDDQEERFRDCEFPKPRTCFDRCWRRWIRNAIDWGNVVPVQTPKYGSKAPEVSPEQAELDRRKGEENLRRLREQASNVRSINK